MDTTLPPDIPTPTIADFADVHDCSYSQMTSTGDRVPVEVDLLPWIRSCYCRVPNPNTWKDYKTAEANFIRNHPHVTTEALATTKLQTHQSLAGGIFMFDDQPVPSDAHLGYALNTRVDNLCRQFLKKGPALLGHAITWREMFWVVWAYYCKCSYSLPTDSYCLNLPLMEVKRPIFAFFLDLDMYFSEPLRIMQWKDLLEATCKVIHEAVFDSYEETDSSHIMYDFTVLETSAFVRKGESKFKKGVHLIWPALHVDSLKARMLAAVIAMHLQRKLPTCRDPTRGENEWFDVVDTSVYSSGLRIPGCPKVAECTNDDYPECRKAWKDRFKLRKMVGNLSDGENPTTSALHRYAIEHCCPEHTREPYGTTFDASTTYRITELWKGGEKLSAEVVQEIIQSHVYQDPSLPSYQYDLSLMRLASIWTSEKLRTAGFKESKDLNAIKACLMVPLGTNGGGKRKASSDARSFENQTEIRPFLVDHQISVSGQLKNKLEKIVRASGLSNHYKRILITRVVGFPARQNKEHRLPNVDNSPPMDSLYREIVMCTTGEGSHFCLKKGAIHSTNTIKFHLTYDGQLSQSCWSSKVHRKMPCKSYTSSHKSVGKSYTLRTTSELRTLVEVMTSPLVKGSDEKKLKVDNDENVATST